MADVPGLNLLIEKARELSGSCDPGDPSVCDLVGDGSDRRFFRIASGTSSFVALVSPRVKGDATDENDSYFHIGRHLYSKGVPVPRILYGDPRRGCFLLEDAGDLHLQKFATGNRAGLESIYRRALLLLVSVHKKAHEGFVPGFCFDTALYTPAFVHERELEYFRKAFLVGYLGLETGPEVLHADFEALADEAGVVEPRFVFHRDFQSRNIMVCRNGLRLIDFQGMRFGPPAYDLASLLVDPYVMLSRNLQEKLAGLYWAGASRFLGCSRGEFLRSYAAARLCRNLQILGAFGFLGIVKGKKHFLDYIPRAWEALNGWLFGPCRGQYPALEKLVAGIRRRGLAGAEGNKM